MCELRIKRCHLSFRMEISWPRWELRRVIARKVGMCVKQQQVSKVKRRPRLLCLRCWSNEDITFWRKISKFWKIETLLLSRLYLLAGHSVHPIRSQCIAHWLNWVMKLFGQPVYVCSRRDSKWTPGMKDIALCEGENASISCENHEHCHCLLN